MNSPRPPWRDHYANNLDEEYHQDYRGETSIKTITAVLILILGLVYTAFYQADYNILSLPELLWNCLVYITPLKLLNFIENRFMTAHALSTPQTHAAKSDLMRRMLGIDQASGIMGTVAQAGIRKFSRVSSLNLVGDQKLTGPPGLGNWDNSCYQNSVLQGFASLNSLSKYLEYPSCANPSAQDNQKPGGQTSESLRSLIAQLNDPTNNGTRIWTPPTLKSMSSWQQQDAQEYFSKVLDEVDKEVLSAARSMVDISGLELPIGMSESSLRKQDSWNSQSRPTIRNPLEGLLAQRVGCTVCGYSEGLSMIPFNCLTVPLGRSHTYGLSECLEEYTKLETIDGVECGKCTLQKMQRLLNTVLDRSRALPDQTVHRQTLARLETVNEALEEDDYDDKTLTQKCKIPSKSRSSTTKSRQAVIARPPKSLAIHVNRSLFDERTGDLAKNYASVRFPKHLDLSPWCLGSAGSASDPSYEEWILDPAISMIAGAETECRVQGPIYELRAVVTHYGRHENGHYIAYRKQYTEDEDEDWWRLSDDDVSKVSEETVLDQGGVFMLFYDCVQPSRPRHFPADGADRVDLTTATLQQQDEEALVEAIPIPPDHDEINDFIPTMSEQAANIPLPEDSASDWTSASATDDTNTSFTMSENTSVSGDYDDETAALSEYAPTKAILIPSYLPPSNQQHGDEERNVQRQQLGGSMVMV